MSRSTPTDTLHPPTRSILKPARSSHAFTPHSSHSSSTLPLVTIYETPRTISWTDNLQNLPLDGPLPALYFQAPPTQNRQQLAELLRQFATQLEVEQDKDRDSERANPPSPQAGRPTYQQDEFPEFRQILIDPWVPGPYYGPVFEGQLAMKLPTLQINRHLSPPLDGTSGHLHWDVTQPISSAKFIECGKILDFESFCNEPATSPRLTKFQIISPPVPSPFGAWQENKLAGVTVGDFMSSLSVTLTCPMSQESIAYLCSEEDQAVLLRTYRARCPNKDDTPRLFDLLSGCTTFGGLTYDREYERERNFPDRNWQIHLLVRYVDGSSTE